MKLKPQYYIESRKKPDITPDITVLEYGCSLCGVIIATLQQRPNGSQYIKATPAYKTVCEKNPKPNGKHIRFVE